MSQAALWINMLCLVVGLACAATHAQEFRPEWRRSLLEDATLHDVTFVGQSGWAVGEQGVVRKTGDGGQTWSLEQAPRVASLRSVCFLTNRIGWIAGGYIESYTKARRGVLFYTDNGGETWRDLTTNDLPFLTKVKFFSLETGVAVGEKLGPNGSGLLVTEDGGLTWRDMPSETEVTSAWRTGDFLSPDRGVIAGRHGALTSWGGGGLSATQNLSLGRSSIHEIHLDPNGMGWLVGDQAQLMFSTNAGVTWQTPKGKLPSHVRDVADFYAVEQRGEKVWVAGKPGTVIWYSPDAGQTWTQQFTNSFSPIRAIHFRDDRQGVALGDFGTLLQTSNGGATWTPASVGPTRRVAALIITSTPAQVPWGILAYYAGENGYRAAVSLPFEQETEITQSELDLQLFSAVSSGGGHVGFIGSRLPVGLPDLSSDREELIAEWNARTDGRLGEILLGGLVAEIRQLRPEVIVLREADPQDEMTRLLNQAVRKAVQDASDPTRHINLSQDLRLIPWRVSRVAVLKNETGPTRSFVSGSRPLVRMGVTVQEASELVGSQILESYSDTDSRAFQEDAGGELLQISELFRGLDLPAGSDARRKLIPLTAEMVEDDDSSAQHAREIRNMAVKARRQFGSSESVLGLLPRQLKGMSSDDASRLLLEMGQEALSVGDWNSAEAIWIELVNQYEDTLAGQRGMQSLVRFWASEEIAWHRSKQVGASRLAVSSNVESAFQLFQKRDPKVLSSDIYREQPSKPAEPSSPVIQASALEESPREWTSGIRDRWLRQAGVLAVVLSQRNPVLLRNEQIQRALSVINRHPVIAGELDELFQRVHQLPKGVPTNWYMPPHEPNIKKTLKASFTNERPKLDGRLSDACWQQVDSQPLTETSGRLFQEGASLIKLCYDREYLYLAASLVKHPDVPLTGNQPAGRHYDADLTGYDRVTFSMDVDRDADFFYELTIDERGWSSESLGGLPVWNPRMFIATNHDQGYWRIEVAIPLAELAPPDSISGNSWGLAVRRTLPTVGWESWQSEVTTDTPTVKEFGRLQFR